jgi:hypothetical protein
MNKSPLLSLLAICTLAVAAVAADANTYQVTGPILQLTDTKIVVQKGKDQWEITRNADTKVTGELKVGAKVTIQYAMTAQTVEVKADKAAKTDKGAAKAAASPAPAATPAK